jgi:DDB1- and CUL4-associated factor 7
MIIKRISPRSLTFHPDLGEELLDYFTSISYLVDPLVTSEIPASASTSGVASSSLPQMQISLDFSVYGLDFHPSKQKLVASSFIETLQNQIIISEIINSQLIKVSHLAIDYPPTKVLWQPSSNHPDLLATSGDFFRVYEVISPDSGNDQLIISRSKMQNVRRIGQSSQEMFAPLTSFDWNITDPSICVTCSVDTTCSVWDMNTQQAKTQLIAHDSEVLDVAFASGVHVFSSVGSDGSVRMFDQRYSKVNQEHWLILQ